jgi:glycerol-3-phosphate acyltransferase PlsX
MGGDHAPGSTVEGAVHAVREGYRVLLLGDQRVIAPLIPEDVVIPVLHAADRIEDDEAPVTAARRKPRASVRVAVEAVASGDALAAVSCGSTGGLLASSMLALGRIEGIERPAIATVLPRLDGGRLVVLDLGANVDCRPRHLLQFARMGVAFAEAVLGVTGPRVGLLSNGSEAGKGNEQTRTAHPLLESGGFHYLGNTEPQAAFEGACDVLVCDGFVGNVMLKTLEGTAAVLGQIIRQEILQHASAKAGAFLLRGPLQRVRTRTDYSAVGGAILLGLNGVVVVGHGRSDPTAVSNAVALAHRAATEGVPKRIAAALSDRDEE